MTTLRQHSQRRNGKLAKHHGMQSALAKVPGLQGKTPVDEPETEVVEAVSVRSLITNDIVAVAHLDTVRRNKDGSANKQDFKREMRARGWKVCREGGDLMESHVWGAV